MNLIYVMTGLSVGLFAVVITALAWHLRSGQCDDLETPAWRMLGEDPPAPPPVRAEPSTSATGTTP